ncbi:MAG: exodeoxyribonuclease V subunit alpha [Balneolaceae bacterium]|nr:exodeoxyribonuclease V subunit alpha [Balneolaceae bacterium]
MSEILQRIRELRDQGIIAEVSYQFCLFLDRVDGRCNDALLLAGCLVSERKGSGDVCVDLREEAGNYLFTDGEKRGIQAPGLREWTEHLKKTESAGAPGEPTPLTLDDSGRLYLQKYWNYEAFLAARLQAMASAPPAKVSGDRCREVLHALFGEKNQHEPDWQKVAAWMAVNQKLTVISGGPGTGKTTTVVNILLLMAKLQVLGKAALAAPTGKAASRLATSVADALSQSGIEQVLKDKIPAEASTLHKLLGAERYGSDFRFNRENPLPYDLVVVDEASMIDLALMVKLVDALPDNARLILLGDKDQLASVEAGAVLGSICKRDENRFSDAFIEQAGEAGMVLPERAGEYGQKPLSDNVVLLTKSYRFGEESGIGQLASKVLNGDSDRAITLMQSDKYSDITFRNLESPEDIEQHLRELVLDHYRELTAFGTVEKALQSLGRLGVLCVHRRGPLGSEQVNLMIEKILREEQVVPRTAEWYPGKPVLVTQNDYTLGLHNGELGIVSRDHKKELKVFFGQKDSNHRSFSPSRLTYAEPAYALTVHKSQGSEFNDVGVVLPPRISAVSSKEMLYTAITRSRNNCSLIGTERVLRDMIERGTSRSSGLQDRLWGPAEKKVE